METVNMMELNSILFNLAIAFQLITGFAGVVLIVLWWMEKIPFLALFGIILTIAVVFLLSLIVVAAANHIPIQEVFKVLFWFNSRR